MQKVAVGIPSLVNDSELDQLCQSLIRQEGVEVHLFLVLNSPHVLEVGRKWQRLGAVTFFHSENIGVAASWNKIIRAAHTTGLFTEGVILLNDDITLNSPTILQELNTVVVTGIVAVEGIDLAAFRIPWKVWDTAGDFDENIWPAYSEDCDYEYKAHLLGFPTTRIPLNITHTGSGSKKKQKWVRSLIDQTRPLVRERYKAKWGGFPREEEYSLPWNGGEPGPNTRLQFLAKDYPVAD